MWVLSKAYQLSSYRPFLHMHTKHALLFSIAHWTCIEIHSLVPLITYPFFYHCGFLHFSLCSIVVLCTSTCASGFFLIGVTYIGRTILGWGLSEPGLVPLSAPRCDNFFSHPFIRFVYQIACVYQVCVPCE
jgi:hypothetical protein